MLEDNGNSNREDNDVPIVQGFLWKKSRKGVKRGRIWKRRFFQMFALELRYWEGANEASWGYAPFNLKGSIDLALLNDVLVPAPCRDSDAGSRFEVELHCVSKCGKFLGRDDDVRRGGGRVEAQRRSEPQGASLLAQQCALLLCCVGAEAAAKAPESRDRRRLYLRAASAVERKEWSDALTMVLRGIKSAERERDRGGKSRAKLKAQSAFASSTPVPNTLLDAQGPTAETNGSRGSAVETPPRAAVSKARNPAFVPSYEEASDDEDGDLDDEEEASDGDNKPKRAL